MADRLTTVLRMGDHQYRVLRKPLRRPTRAIRGGAVGTEGEPTDG